MIVRHCLILLKLLSVAISFLCQTSGDRCQNLKVLCKFYNPCRSYCKSQANFIYSITCLKLICFLAKKVEYIHSLNIFLFIELLIFHGQSDCLFKLSQLTRIQNTIFSLKTIAVTWKIMLNFLYLFLLLPDSFPQNVFIFSVTIF